MADSQSGPDWLRLDNAAKIYPPAYSEHAPEVFRVGVTLMHPVRINALQKALARVIARCPYYQVHLRRGLFWYYLQRHETPPTVELLQSAPVSRIRMRSETEQLFRVFARDSRIHIDFSHVLTDGSGAFTFLATLVAEYLRQIGIPVPSGGMILDPDERPHPEEFQDSYPELYEAGTPNPEPLSLAYHIPERPASDYHRIISGRVRVNDVLNLAREHTASLTEFLAGVYIHAIYRIWKEAAAKPRNRNVIRLEVPADMRRLHPSRTMRNFSLFVAPEIDLRLGEYSLPQIIDIVHHMMHLQLDPRVIRRQVARNVGGENLAIVRIVPLILKDWYLSSLHHRLGANISSGVISNLGSVAFPEAMQAQVADVRFVLGTNPTLRKTISVVGYNGNVNITIGSVSQSRDLERIFFTTLTDLGLRVIIEEQES